MADDEKKKPSLASVIEMEPKGKGDDMDSDEDGGDFDAAAEELFEAIKSDDMEGFKTALRAVKAC